ncbi:TonB-dependent receptor [Novosphingobium sp. Gsoil 351]|uniref:TonB-dependent receptor n=1 Tax=Novosphingobium sp. Gsoil 351 TaxID=2675225 RepID=UPI0018A83FF3|nr:TonB-dependent receptor [Novosphingobium sp. Gsoil 351]
MALAQAEQPAGDDDAQPGEIIVTANKYEERIQDVALSISAVAGDELERQQVQDIQDLARTVPGISFIRAGSIAGAGNQIIIRGLNTGSGAATVASVVDEAPLSFSVGNASFATDFEPWDLDRVEVLRGPQGSLYGATAQGGLIKYVTQAPNPARLAAGFDFGMFDIAHGDMGAVGRGYVNVPVASDVAALRVSGYYQYAPGWIDNQLGRRQDANGFTRYGGRASLLVTPADNLSIRLTAIYQDLKTDGFDAIEVNGLTQPSNQFAPLKGYNLDTFLPQPGRVKAQLYIGNLTYDFGGVGIQSITSYGKLDNFRTNDVPLYGQVFGGLLFGRPNTTLFYIIDTDLSKISQEFRLYSTRNAKEEGGLQWQLGGFYTREKTDALTNYYTKDAVTGANVATPFGGASGALVLQANQFSRYREIAGYADLTYFFSPRFDIEAGARVFENKQHQDGIQGGPFLGVPLGQIVPRLKSGETSWTFSVAPRFHFSQDAMIYGRVASGYRPGGPQSFIPNAPAGLPSQFDSDKTISYELGLKGTFLDRLLSVDIAAFYIDWRDVQITVAFPSGGVAYNVTGNVGRAVSKGLEWTFSLRPVRGLNLTALGSYTDAKFSRDAPGIGAADGDRLPYVPKLNTTVSATYEFDLSDDMTASVNGSWSHVSSQFNSYALTPTISHLPFPGYDTFAAQIGVKSGPFGVMLYGKNLTDKRGITFYYAGQSALGGTIPAQTGLIRPREIGIKFTGNF